MDNENTPTSIPVGPEDMEAFLDLVRTARIMQDYMNDQTAHGIAEIMATVFKLANAVISTDMVDVIERGLQDPELDKALINPPKVGFGGLLKQMQDEDFQKGLGVMLTLVKAIGRATED
ncbi:DUF1641 domain-containing protein [Methanolobus mangrovi]|uniref:DUF1641 domain-containing protein n=1 Tax=Methanolobus mangrovi TaxID=3072977 RepID=A0AA51YI39_9EURY|nr:DUF1641 domain-containing protein [Methanolobus mangrovi]WMW21123.1 DUF1641 domain-containing protein [Methanolobus mangrovi]